MIDQSGVGNSISARESIKIKVFGIIITRVNMLVVELLVLQ